MASGGGGKDSGREGPVSGFGNVEDGLGEVLTQGIELGWPEEEDRGEGATSRRAVELRSALDEMRRKRELTSGSHIHPDKYLAMPRGLSASLERTVHESGVTIMMTWWGLLGWQVATSPSFPFGLCMQPASQCNLLPCCSKV